MQIYLFVMKINHGYGQPSRPKLEWTFPQKTASFPRVRDSDWWISHKNKNVGLLLFPNGSKLPMMRFRYQLHVVSTAALNKL